MIISSSRNFIFIHLEKCGGTSVETALQPHLAWYDMILGSTEFGEKLQYMYYERFGREEVNKYMLWKHSTAKDIHAFLGDGWDDFTKISVVRNPEDLIKSFYFFSQTTMKYHVGRIGKLRWEDFIRTNQFPEMYPFTEKYFLSYAQCQIEGAGIDRFVDLILNNDYQFISPQVDRISLNHNDDLGIVVDLSQMKTGWSKILDAANISQNIKLEKLNISERYPIDLSSKSIKMIHRHFAVDYDILPRYTNVSW